MINIPAVLIDRMRKMEDRPRSAYDELAEAYQEQETTIETLEFQIQALNTLNPRLRELLSAFVYNRTPEGYIRLSMKAVELLEEK